jgi:transcriptional regulator of acetoin/glycerol metabolism
MTTLSLDLSRKFSSSTIPGIAERGLRLGDEIILSPVYGRKKSIKLHRTHIHFFSNDLDQKVEAYPIILPSFGEEKLSYSLVLCKNDNDQIENKSRYLLRSNENKPFKINGTYSFESFIERGDKVQIGHNILDMRPILMQKEIDMFQHEILRNEKLIRSDLNILIQGQTGTGKTHLAGLIHKQSERKGPFVHINLSAFAPSLLESELFGHVKGAFTGALNEKKGALLEARDGTLFLDEIDSLPIDIQTKLLLFLDDKKIRPVGGERTIQCPTRLIFAGAKPLATLVEKKLMREDFYFRLSTGHKIELVPLRNNTDLIKTFCYQYSLKNDVCFSNKLIEFYQSLPWPGNIRQLLGHLDKKKALSASRKFDFDELDSELIAQSSSLFKLEPDEQHFLSLQMIQRNYAYKVFNYLNQDLGKSAGALRISIRRLKRILSSS